MCSRSRIARASRSTAADISRRAIGSWRWSNCGRRNRRALSGSASPRWTSTRAARGPIFSAAASATASGGSSGGGIPRVSVLGEIPAKGIAFVELILADYGGDLVFDGQKLFVPIGLDFVDVEVRIVIEGELERAGEAFVLAQLAQARLVIALVVIFEFEIVELFEQIVDIAGFEFPAAEQDQLDADFRRGIEKHLVVRIVLGVPEDHLGAVHRAGAAAED